MQIDDMPGVSEALIEALEKRFPCGPPQASESDIQLYVRAGHAEIIAYLHYVFDAQKAGSNNQESSNVLLIPEHKETSPNGDTAGRRRTRRRTNSR